MLSLVASLGGAVLFGVADFLGGLASRRLEAARVVALSQLLGLIALLPLLLLVPAVLDPASIAWGAASGVANAVGLVLFYRALAVGRMSVVAPVAALTSALVPLVVGVVLGERLAPQALAGAGLALVAIVLVSSQDGRIVPPRRMLADRSTVIALAAGAVFGVFFVLISRASPESGFTPLAAARVVSIVLILLAFRSARSLRAPTAALPLIGAAGIAGNLGNVLFVVGARLGLLSISGVVSSLYPAATVLLAILVLHERVRRVQVAGFALSVGALVLLAAS